jgi:hypothetical protein
LGETAWRYCSEDEEETIIGVNGKREREHGGNNLQFHDLFHGHNDQVRNGEKYEKLTFPRLHVPSPRGVRVQVGCRRTC